ncbi:MAG: TRAP transporter fused permease subunit [Burkholderiales bacterium]|nr:MAG: TRAP transporter fused permease subunit [Burkholderiales bacterium]
MSGHTTDANTSRARTPLLRALERAGLAVCALLALMTVHTVVGGQFSPQLQRGSFLLAAGTAAFLLQPTCAGWRDAGRGPRFWLDFALSLCAAGLLAFSVLYYLAHYFDIANYREGIPNRWDLACYAAGIIAVLEGIRRTEGWPLVIVILAVIAYLLFGAGLPGIFGHQGLSLSDFLESSYGLGGMFGVALAVVANVIYMFVLYGAIMRTTGAGRLFIELAFALTARHRGGPAQAAVVASTLFGTISGSGPANVVSTGAFTIPLMKRAGYRPEFAGAVEATASTVGQIMPPVMGVAVFIMAEITGIHYGRIMVAATIPALLYILSLLVAVWLRAQRRRLPTLAPEEAPRLAPQDVPRLLLLLASIATIAVVVLLGRTPALAGLAGGAVLLAGALIMPDRPGPRSLVAMLVAGGRDGIGLTLACAGIGIIISGLSATGLGIKLTQAIVLLGQDSLLMSLILAAACCLVIGMGLPTAAAYLVVVYVAAPALTKLGMPLLSAHLFVFYYAVLSAITPPVAISAFAAAGISGASPLATGVQSVRLALVAFLLPLAWIYNPDLLLADGIDARLPWEIACVAAAVVALTAANIGYLRAPLGVIPRLLLAAAGLVVASANTEWRLAGLALMLALTWIAPRLAHARTQAPDSAGHAP